MSDLEVNAQIRAHAVQAAGIILGSRAYELGGPGYTFDAKPSTFMVDLTKRIEDYIRHGNWNGNGS